MRNRSHAHPGALNQHTLTVNCCPPAHDPTLEPANRHENGESAWTAPFADDDGEGELVNGRKLKKGWRKVGPDADGDIWYEDASGNSVVSRRRPDPRTLAGARTTHPNHVHNPATRPLFPAQWTPPYADEEEGGQETVDGRKLKVGWKRCSDDEGDVWYEGPDGASSWTPPFADGDADGGGDAGGDEPAFETDGPGGARLRAGWKRCSDESGDVWVRLRARPIATANARAASFLIYLTKPYARSQYATRPASAQYEKDGEDALWEAPLWEEGDDE